MEKGEKMNSKISTKRKALAVVAALTLVFSSSVMAFAASTQTQAQAATSTKVAKVSLTDEQKSAIEQARSESVTEAFAQLVNAGTITQEEADNVPYSVGKTSKTSSGGIFTGLTDDQRQALEEERQTERNEALAALVSAGTITQDQADKFTTKEKANNGTELTEDQRTAIKEAMESGQNNTLTTDQRTALQDSVKAIFESKLASLVAAGTITQEQSDFFANAEGHNGFGGFDHDKFGGHGRTDSNSAPTDNNSVSE
ncbi:hypothetical protein [Clostridium aminobutyricum]|uniref:DUF2680 domain-containing protein n=1 Tax=Clostridium aminobutyricum TaxID=33953 RepID=A0A939IJH1_CLOAM|nr:hypothetical protein [Clostridium aminobutyricum]MBN7773579.1 hypothetical protein [Clostridium aminobutyricum]